MRQPDRNAPFEAVLLLPGAADAPTEVAPRNELTRLLVEGVHCANGHFNDPAVPYCQMCGISMAQRTHITVLGPRPPLGVLLVDDGATFRLDADYVVGREPHRDSAVAHGARPLRIAGPASGVSRQHLRMALAGWTVRAVDLGSANGTVVEPPGDPHPRRLQPGVPAEIRPGTRVVFGTRWLRYESHRNP
ncbi:FHA domain-containing protein [Plantactinospora sp. DSM 117369]